MRVTVVGAGISGLSCARTLAAGGVTVDVLDRGRVAGGRLASRRLHDRVVDIGAAYATASDAGFAAQLAEWQDRGLARPWTDTFAVLGADPAAPTAATPKPGPVRYAAPGGLRSWAADLAAGLGVQQGSAVAAVTAGGPGRRPGVRLADPAEAPAGPPPPPPDPADLVVLAMPDPQADRLLAADPAAGPVRAALRPQQWSPVLTLVAAFPARTWAGDGYFVGPHSPAAGTLDTVCDDGARRGDGAPVLVAHSTAAAAAPHLADPGGAVAPLLAALRAALDLPAPAWTHVHRWSYARPTGPRPEPFALDLERGLAVCGDGWGEPKVQTAWCSGRALADAVLRSA